MSDRSEEDDDSFVPLVDVALRYVKPLVPVVIVVGSALFWVLRGAGAGILVLSGGLVVAVIAALWHSIRVLTGDAELQLESTLALGEVTHEDEGKRAILRALKDLEYEHAVGKLSDDDFKTMTAQYRAEARKVLRALDQSLEGQRKRAIALVEARLAKEPIAAKEADEAPAAEAPEKEPVAEGKTPELEETKDETVVETKSAICPSCATKNDADATFCKRCAAKLEGSVELPAPDSRRVVPALFGSRCARGRPRGERERAALGVRRGVRTVARGSSADRPTR